jgi:tRNA(Ile2) C34 agmatinyltransferase TiaS
MADGAGIDLDDGGAGFAQAAGVVVGGEVADDYGCFQSPTQTADGFADEGRFTRAGGGEDVNDEQTARAEEAAVALGEEVVFLQDGAVEIQRLAFFRGGAG